jgi:hypothetical protein
MISDGLFSLQVEVKFQVLKLSSRFQIPEFQNPGINALSRAFQVSGTTPFFSRIFVPRTTGILKHRDFGRDAQFSLTYGRM